MPNKPEGAYSPTDDDLDDIIETVEKEEGDTPDDAPRSQAGAPTGDEPAAKRETPEAPDKAPRGDDEVDEDLRETAGAEDTGEGEPEPVAAAASQPAIPPGSKPFQYRGAGADLVLPGAHELPDGNAFITKDALPHLRQLLASEAGTRQGFQQYRRDAQRQIEGLKTARVAREEEAEAVYQLFTDLKKMTPEERWDFFQKFEEETPKLELAIERKKIDNDRKDFERAKQGPQLSVEEQQEQVQQLLTGELGATFRTLTQHADAKLFTREELLELWNKWAKRPQMLARVLPADEGQFKKGQAVFDDGMVWEDFHLLAGLKKRSGAQAPVGAAARNAVLNADRRPAESANPIPPAVQPTRTGADGRPRAPSYSKDRKRFKKDFMSGKLDAPE